jgi:2-hydroxy-3-oxopropionate reductase
MGWPIARRLAQAESIDLTVFDLNADAVASFDGESRRAASFDDAITGADVVLTILPADDHVRSVADVVAKVGAPGMIFLDFSTIGPATIRGIADSLSPLGIATVSVGMTRSTAAAEAGTLVLYVGGQRVDVETAAPIFEAVSEAAPLVGSLEAAKVMKLANNLVIATINIAILEAVALAERCGLTVGQVVDGLRERGVTSWVLTNHIEQYVIPDDLGPGRFSTVYMAKDMALCSEIATGFGYPAMFPGMAAAMYRGTTAMGFGQHYHMIVLEWLRRSAAVQDSRASLDDPSGALDSLAAGVDAIQRLVTEEAVELAARSGVDADEAREHLSNGSAGNVWLSSTLGKGHHQPGVAENSRALLDDVIALARRVDYPGLVFESARVGTFR